MPDPDGTHLVVLARDPEGYARLSRVIAEAHLAGGEKGKPIITLDELADRHGGHWQVLTGCRKGALATALTAGGPAAAARVLDHLIGRFGRDHLAVELWDHGNPIDATRNDALALLAIERGVAPVATNNVHYATPSRFPLATALAAVRARRTLADLEGWLPSSATACLRGEAEQRRRFARWPGVVDQAAEIAAGCAFDLRLVAPRLPDFPVPDGHTEQTWLVELVRRGAADRYGPPGAERVPGAWAQLDHELAIIGELGFPGYFLTVWDIVRFCREQDIFCQGRGSAATSAVCYALGITNVDAVALGLLFERFLSPARDGPPDIDVDIESGRREEVIQYVYERYGRLHAAQVANVITYRSRSALRDMGKALGHTAEEVDAWSKSVDRGEPIDQRDDLPPLVGRTGHRADRLPAPPGHPLGGHGHLRPAGGRGLPGRVGPDARPHRAAVGQGRLCRGRAGQVRPARAGHADRAAPHGGPGTGVPPGRGGPGPAGPGARAVYDLLCRADTVGVFQVGVRAQMNTLPRVQPRCFYDLAIEVALIRPGPIQGHAVHPYIRRRNGTEPVTYLHPLLQPALERTLGVPLFQEQLMQIAIDVAGFTPTEADELRQAMSAKRSGERMARLRDRLFAGMAARAGLRGGGRAGLHGAGRLRQLRFPREPLGGLRLPGVLHRLVQGALSRRLHRRAVERPAHGVLVPPEPGGRRQAPRGGGPAPRRERRAGRRRPRSWRGRPAPGPSGGAAGAGLGARHRDGDRGEDRRGAPWSRQEDLVRRAGVTRAQLEALATAGALDGLGSGRPGGAAGPERTGRAEPAVPGVGGGGGRPGHRRTGSPAWSPDRIRHRSPSPPCGRGWPTTCGPSG